MARIRDVLSDSAGDWMKRVDVVVTFHVQTYIQVEAQTGLMAQLPTVT